MNGNHQLNLIMELYTMGNGKMGKEMEEESKFGKMGLSIKAIGKMIWPMDKED